MTFNDNQIKGNWGEQHVAERLASCGCLIRHVPQGHDSGIDLYCESTEDGKPFLHFWAQVKVSKAFDSSSATLSYSASDNELTYWLEQPIPTFLFLIPDRRGEQPPVFLCSPLIRTRKSLKSFAKISIHQELTGFLREGLPYWTFLWELHHGKVTWIKTPTPNYTIQVPVGITHQFEPQLRGSLHRTLARLTDDILSQAFEIATLRPLTADTASNRRVVDMARPYAEALERIVEGKGIGNYENFMTIGIVAELDGDREKAAALYRRALASIDGDPNIDRSQEPWRTSRAKVEAHLARASGQL